MTGPEIERLIQLFARLPGLGPRSARRAVLRLIKRKDDLFAALTEAMGHALDKVQLCSECGNVDSCNPCTICRDPKRDLHQLVVVEDITDLWALERAQASRGRYHVLGGVLSALDGIGPEDLFIGKLIERAQRPEVNEVILALNATPDGQTTAYYITDHLEGLDVRVTRLAHGVPVGGELDYLDEGTISAAFRSRAEI